MQIILSKTAGRYFERLNEPTLTRIYDALVRLAEDPPRGDIKKLEGRGEEYRLRIGSYRALFTIEEDKIIITAIASRGQAYKE